MFSAYRFWLLRQNKSQENKIRKIVQCLLFSQFVALFVFQMSILLVEYPPYYRPEVLICTSSQYKDTGIAGTFTSTLGILFTVIPVILMAVMNCGIYVIITLSGARLKRAAPRRTLVALGALTWLFVVSNSFLVGHFVLDKVTAEAPWYELTMMYLLSLNSICNPLIYFYTNKRFRNFLLGTITTGNWNATPSHTEN